MEERNNYVENRAKMLFSTEVKEINDILELMELPKHRYVKVEYFDDHNWRNLEELSEFEANNLLHVSAYEVDDEYLRYFVHYFVTNNMNYELNWVCLNTFKVTVYSETSLRRSSMYTKDETLNLLKDLHKLSMQK